MITSMKIFFQKSFIQLGWIQTQSLLKELIFHRVIYYS